MGTEWITTTDARGDTVHLRCSRIVAIRDYGGSCVAIMVGGGEIALRKPADEVRGMLEGEGD